MRNKFFAKSFVDENGIKWDSKKEYKRYIELSDLEGLTNNITFLDRQVSFLLLPKHKCLLDKRAEQPVSYTCDFVYIKGDTLYIEDVKSDFTRKDVAYILRRKMFKYFYLNSEDKEFKKLHEKFEYLDFKDAQFVEYIEGKRK